MKYLSLSKITLGLFLIFLCISCEIGDGKFTKIEGYVIDEFTGQRVSNVLIDIVDCKRGIGSRCGTKDTIRTNSDGYYEYSFYTESGVTGYYISIHYDDEKYYNETQVREVRGGFRNKIDLKARPFKVLKLNFSTSLETDFKIFSMQIQNTQLFDTTGLYSNVDTTLYIPIIPSKEYRSTAYFRKRFIQEYFTKQLIFETTQADTTVQDFFVP